MSLSKPQESDDTFEFTREHPEVLEQVIKECVDRGYEDLAAAAREARRQLFESEDSS